MISKAWYSRKNPGTRRRGRSAAGPARPRTSCPPASSTIRSQKKMYQTTIPIMVRTVRIAGEARGRSRRSPGRRSASPPAASVFACRTRSAGRCAPPSTPSAWRRTGTAAGVSFASTTGCTCSGRNLRPVRASWAAGPPRRTAWVALAPRRAWPWRSLGLAGRTRVGAAGLHRVDCPASLALDLLADVLVRHLDLFAAVRTRYDKGGRHRR